jgi:hypothetical protein
VFENRMLRRILGPKREAINGGWRKLYNYYFSTINIREAK